MASHPPWLVWERKPGCAAGRRWPASSYRRDDTGWAATTLADALRRRVGVDRVFLDTGSIALGDSFAATIEDAVRGSAVLLALVGARYDTARLQDPRDWVRRELLLARECGVRIVPVPVDRAQLPPDLPRELRFLEKLLPAGPPAGSSAVERQPRPPREPGAVRDAARLQGLFRGQAARLADHLRS